jgi:hypothetical protein
MFCTTAARMKRAGMYDITMMGSQMPEQHTITSSRRRTPASVTTA